MPLSQRQPTYLGCFHDNIQSPDLTGEPPSIIARAEACITHCSIGTWSYAAVRNKTICTCGDTFNKYGKAPASACSTACPEDQSAFDDCGGPETNSIYSVGLVAPKPPVPTPSVNPNVGYPTPPLHPNNDSGANDKNPGYLSGTSTSKTAVISSTVVAVAVLAIGIMSLMVYRKKRTPSSLPKSKGQGPTFDREGTKESDRSMDDKKNTSSMGLRWFSVGSTSKSGDNNYDEDDYQDAGKYRSGARDTKRSGDMEKQLFEGFESSVILEDYAPAHQPVHPLDWKPDGHQHSRRASAEIGPAGDIEFIARASRKPSVDVVSDSGRCSMQQEELSEISAPLPGVQGSTSLASKIGQKLSHLRVKTYLLQPNHHRSFEGPDAIAPAMPPVSPISPMSPASISSSSTSSPTKMGLGSFPSEARRRSDHDIAISLGTAIERDPASATPSFSLATAPVPGTASNRRAQSITTSKHILREMPSLERFQSQDGAIYHSIDYGPPSPISPTNHFASQGLPNQGNRQNQHQYARHQKEHRSNLIKDLILQGDSLLEDKEMAMMAQYQPYHSRQQQQQLHQYQQLHQQHPHYCPTNASSSSRFQHRRSSSTTSKSLQAFKADQKSAPAQRPSELSLLASSKPTTVTPSSSIISVPHSTAAVLPDDKQRKENIPKIDTNFLAPPPRILIHKAL